MRNHLLSLVCFLLATTATAQHLHKVSLGLRAIPFPCDFVLAGGSLSYYHTNSPRTAWGFKANYNTDALGADPYYSRTHAVNLDLVHQIRLAGGKKSDWLLDLGVSGLAVIDVQPERYSGLECIAGMTVAQIQRALTENYNRQVETRYYPGFALATAFERRLGKRWGIGAELTLNTYYTPDECSPITPYPNPSLFLSRRF